MLIRVPTPEPLIQWTSLISTISIFLLNFNTFRHSYEVNMIILVPNEKIWTQSFTIGKVLNVELKPFNF